MKFNVILLPRAQCDVDGILGWLHARSPQGAAGWYRCWLELLERLEEWANGCGLAPEDEDHDETIRHTFFKTRRGRPYRAIFVIRGRTVYVMHVRGAGQRLLGRDELQLPQ